MKFNGKLIAATAIFAIILIALIAFANANIPYDPEKEIQNSQPVEVKATTDIAGSLKDFFDESVKLRSFNLKNSIITQQGDKLRIQFNEEGSIDITTDIDGFRQRNEVYAREIKKGGSITMDKNGNVLEAKIEIDGDIEAGLDSRSFDVKKGTFIEIKDKEIKMSIPKNAKIPQITFIEKNEPSKYNYEFFPKDGPIYFTGNLRLDSGSIFLSEVENKFYISGETKIEGINFNTNSKTYLTFPGLPPATNIFNGAVSEKSDDYISFKFLDPLDLDENNLPKPTKGVMAEFQKRASEIEFATGKTPENPFVIPAEEDKGIDLSKRPFPTSFSAVSNKNQISFKVDSENIFFQGVPENAYLSFSVGGKLKSQTYSTRDIGINAGALSVAYYGEGIDVINPDIKTFIATTGEYRILNGENSYSPGLDLNGNKKLQIGKNTEADYQSSMLGASFILRVSETIFVSSQTGNEVKPGTSKWELYQLSGIELLAKQRTYYEGQIGQPIVKITKDYLDEFKKRDPDSLYKQIAP